ncbi:MAG: uroporphyrinogen decarboxylase family protein [Candidatus Brocadiia bacterium]
MANDTPKSHDEKLKRYKTALHNGKPDCVPIRPFVAEFVAKYAGYTCQEVTHDYNKAIDATIQCAADFDWDATVPNMVYVWTGLTEAVGLKYYGVPGIDIEEDVGFQYREPAEEDAFMRADEYDRLIDDPTAFLYEVWFPRVAEDICATGDPTTYRHSTALVRSAMAMLQYFMDLGAGAQRMQDETGTVPAIGGILKAPFDILADKFRGYYGLTMDMHTQPEKVLAAAEALAPHLLRVAIDSADPTGTVPVAIWMHRGCVPFVTPAQFDSHYWPTLKPIIQELWKRDLQTLFYAEGDWNAHLDSFTELPDRSIVFHVDRADIFEVYEKLGDKFCISGGIPNFLLSYGSPDEVRDCCRKIIDGVAADGGYIADAGAIMQDDTCEENLRVMTEFVRDYGTYSSGGGGNTKDSGESDGGDEETDSMPLFPDDNSGSPPGTCVPWEKKRSERGPITGSEELVERIWQQVDANAYTFIWHWVVSF